MIPQLIQIPTGLGKTAMVVIGWLWRRFCSTPSNSTQTSIETPRRLIYCLPMRGLAEQTAHNANQWIQNLQKAQLVGEIAVPVTIIVGGEDTGESWDKHPERAQILVGTQDLLLSKALNRGYGVSHPRWPMQFGLLHVDTLWVFDEIELMGDGLATTTQLDAFRRILPSTDHDTNGLAHGCRSVWMSAAIPEKQLATVDFEKFATQLPTLRFDRAQEAANVNESALRALDARLQAVKPVSKANANMNETEKLAAEVCREHTEASMRERAPTRTIVVVNTVSRARNLYDAIRRRLNAQEHVKPHNRAVKCADQDAKEIDVRVQVSPQVVLLHSCFRPADRRRQTEQALSALKDFGTIVVCTQVIEAGLDVNATTLFSEMAPWPALLQRFGRCNRYGDSKAAKILWIDFPQTEKKLVGRNGPALSRVENLAAPYSFESLNFSRQKLLGINDASVNSLPIDYPTFNQPSVLRRKDLVDLFDTTADLAGDDIDIDRFVRSSDNSDVQLVWRSLYLSTDAPPSRDLPAPSKEEMCKAPLTEFAAFHERHGERIWVWRFLWGRWTRFYEKNIVPGHVYLISAQSGGYASERGWDPFIETPVIPLVAPANATDNAPDATAGDSLSQIGVWQTIAQHCSEVHDEVQTLINVLSIQSGASALLQAARWHDRGKVHDVFQAALPEDAPIPGRKDWAKAKGDWKHYSRLHFRHELASAIAVLLAPESLIPPEDRDLVAYLVAAHHGKIRLSIRALPREKLPKVVNSAHHRFARGIWETDQLIEVDLGHGITAPAINISLEPMELSVLKSRLLVNHHGLKELFVCVIDTDLFTWLISRQSCDALIGGVRSDKPKKNIAQALDPPWNVCMDNIVLHAERWSDPLGAQWLPYARARNCFQIGSGVSAGYQSEQPKIQMVRFAIDSIFLPPVISTLPIAEATRRTLMGIHGRLTQLNGMNGKSSIFSGKDETGVPLIGHRHAYYVPTDEDGDGQLDHITVYSEDGFDDNELRALDMLDAALIGSAAQKQRLRFLLTDIAKLDEYHHDIFGCSHEWVSATPYIATRHPKIGGKHRNGVSSRESQVEFICADVHAQVTAMLSRRRTVVTGAVNAGVTAGLNSTGTAVITSAPQASNDDMAWQNALESSVTVEPIWGENENIEAGERRQAKNFIRTRLKSGDDGGMRPSGFFRLRFFETVKGPISLGFSSHFGMGLFAPACT